MGGRRRKSSLRKRHELCSSDLLDIVSYWQAHQPSMAQLGSVFDVSVILA